MLEMTEREGDMVIVQGSNRSAGLLLLLPRMGYDLKQQP
jgi:hypothetical protein